MSVNKFENIGDALPYFKRNGAVILNIPQKDHNYKHIVDIFKFFSVPVKGYQDIHPFIDIVSSISGTKINQKNMIIQSTSNDKFLPHTDGSVRFPTYHTIGLFCFNPASKGGQTILIPVKEIIKNLDKKVIQILSEPFPFGDNYSPIISSQNELRFNERYLEKTLEVHQYQLSSEQALAIKHLKSALVELEEKHTHTLDQGAFLIFLNKSFLHGRRSFEGENREFWRIRGDRYPC